MDNPSHPQEDEDILCSTLATNSSSTKVKVNQGKSEVITDIILCMSLVELCAIVGLIRGLSSRVNKEFIDMIYILQFRRFTGFCSVVSGEFFHIYIGDNLDESLVGQDVRDVRRPSPKHNLDESLVGQDVRDVRRPSPKRSYFFSFDCPSSGVPISGNVRHSFWMLGLTLRVPALSDAM
ncbi:hypothetical protein QE152_g15783 [Popillia japonica]|uniref:Uncharacterized protein n=1 Tax=Popillia japonica TaxID=7064 RepID=A0AAW1L7G0_POPJA